ncbi:16S rRNA (guanine(966)-N(2))-methyltransferase RsmD [Thioalkalivibrio sp.]|uniref:16S rRNA (guanine(966)-N(2))-methyltransferase RsmD n=1 Tax=Thioalkalivibrio sp. TaxID=2093813 RepID=UPI003976A855
MGRAARVRIIGGAWRRRWLPVAPVPGLRPSADAQRETLFNWLQPLLPGAAVLDLFAGTGALGLEAASRGAGSVLLVEKSPVAVDQLEANLRLLGAKAVTVRRADALRLLAQGPQAGGAAPFDIVFIDPPFGQCLVAPVLERLRGGGWLAPRARVYVEQESGLPAPADWDIVRERIGGQAHGLLLVEPKDSGRAVASESTTRPREGRA